MKNIILLVISAALLLAGCSTVNNLEYYNLDNTDIALSVHGSHDPVVESNYGYNNDENENGLVKIVRLGVNLVKASESRETEQKMRKALRRENIPELIAEVAFEEVLDTFNARETDSTRRADMLFDIEIDEYGISADSYGGTEFFIKLDARLYYLQDDEMIWRRRVTVREEVSPDMFGNNLDILGNIVSAAVLNSLTEEELADAFYNLALDAAYDVSDILRDDLHDARYGR